MKPNIVPSNGQAPDVMPLDQAQELINASMFEHETPEEAESEGPDAESTFWQKQISAALLGERRWRAEALNAEELAFGPDNDPGDSSSESGSTRGENRIDDKTAMIHANVEVLKPMVFSETPQPIVRRRFRGDGAADVTDLMAAETGQRIATWLIDTEPFDDAMKGARDDWLIPGRGIARVYYKAEFGLKEINPEIALGLMAAGVNVQTDESGRFFVEEKTSEQACVEHVEWRRATAPSGFAWKKLPWIAFEIPMTRHDIEERFGAAVAAMVNYNHTGLVDAAMRPGDSEQDRMDRTSMRDETGAHSYSPFDTAAVWEIWDRLKGEVKWWTPGAPEILGREPDPLLLEHFFPIAKPLLATVKGSSLSPRPDVRYYEKRAEEIEKATKKLRSLLDVISVSALIPGNLSDELKKILQGENTIVPVKDWIGLMDKGGTNNVVQWLPLQAIVAAINALIALRDQSKMAMFEASGISDLMRAQGDPDETATAQQMKGRYANLRLADRQRMMAVFARDTLRLMIEIALEHFDMEFLYEIVSLNIPLYEAERQQMIAELEQAKATFAATVQAYQVIAQQIMADAAAAGADEEQAAQLVQQQLGPPPQEPEWPKIPETSFELVHARLREDMPRKISVQIETQSTVLADEQADKEARVEFLAAMSTFVQQALPLVNTGMFDMKVFKELLLFGVRGFPKSRTIESLITALPDEPAGQQAPDTQIQVAQLKGEIDKILKQMDMQNEELNRQHDMRMEGLSIMADAQRLRAEPAPPMPKKEEPAKEKA